MTTQRILGRQVRDLVTGWEGIATSRTECLDGSVLLAITPAIDSNGRLRKPKVFAEAQCQMIGAGINISDLPSEQGGITHQGQHYDQPAVQQ